MGCVVFSLFLGVREKCKSMTPAPEAWRVPLRSQRNTRVAEPGCAPGQCLQLWGSNAIPYYIYMYIYSILYIYVYTNIYIHKYMYIYIYNVV